MKSKSIEQRIAFRRKMHIAQIIGLIKEGKVNSAVDIAMGAGISSKAFGIITSHVGDTDTMPITDAINNIYREIF